MACFEIVRRLRRAILRIAGEIDGSRAKPIVSATPRHIQNGGVLDSKRKTFARLHLNRIDAIFLRLNSAMRNTEEVSVIRGSSSEIIRRVWKKALAKFQFKRRTHDTSVIGISQR